MLFLQLETLWMLQQCLANELWFQVATNDDDDDYDDGMTQIFGSR